MCRTTRPISSMWPTTIVSGPSPLPFTRATDEPTTSPETSAPNSAAASRHTRAGAVSYPDGPGAVSSELRRSGSGTGARERLIQGGRAKPVPRLVHARVVGHPRDEGVLAALALEHRAPQGRRLGNEGVVGPGRLDDPVVALELGLELTRAPT